MEFDREYFDKGIERKGTDCVKWDLMIKETGNPDMIPMWVADMDFPSPPAVSTALQEVLDRGTWGYTLAGAADHEALCAFWKRRHHLEIPEEAVLMSPCVVTGMRVCIQALTNPGDGVLIHSPVYGPFFDANRDGGRIVVESPMTVDAEGIYHIDFADTEEKLASGKARAVLFCSPHNPCGRVWTKEELQRLLDLCIRYHAPLICDEIHADFVFDGGEHYSIFRMEGADDAAVMLCAASKTFNVAGLQQSSIVCKNAAWREKIHSEMVKSGVVSGNAFALAATRAAYMEGDAWLDGLLVYLAENRDTVVQHAMEKWPDIHVTRLSATYLMWLDCRALGLEQEELMSRILACGVKLNDGLFFGEQGRGFVRLNIACPRRQLEEALRRLDEVFSRKGA